MTAPTFRAWLARQVLRHDAIGDIARDIRDDHCAAGLGTTQLRDHLARDHAAIPAALTAYDRAVTEWQQRRRQARGGAGR